MALRAMSEAMEGVGDRSLGAEMGLMEVEEEASRDEGEEDEEEGGGLAGSIGDSASDEEDGEEVGVSELMMIEASVGVVVLFPVSSGTGEEDEADAGTGGGRGAVTTWVKSSSAALTSPQRRYAFIAAIQIICRLYIRVARIERDERSRGISASRHVDTPLRETKTHEC